MHSVLKSHISEKAQMSESQRCVLEFKLLFFFLFSLAGVNMVSAKNLFIYLTLEISDIYRQVELLEKKKKKKL